MHFLQDLVEEKRKFYGYTCTKAKTCVVAPLDFGEAVVELHRNEPRDLPRVHEARYSSSHSVGILTHAHMVSHATHNQARTRQTVLCRSKLLGAPARTLELPSLLDLQHRRTFSFRIAEAAGTKTAGINPPLAGCPRTKQQTCSFL